MFRTHHVLALAMLFLALFCSPAHALAGMDIVHVVLGLVLLVGCFIFIFTGPYHSRWCHKRWMREREVEARRFDQGL